MAPAAMVRVLFFFSSRSRHTILQGDWSSDVCNSGCTAISNNWVFTNPPGILGNSQTYTANGLTITAYGYNTNGTAHALYGKVDTNDEAGLGLNGTVDFEIGNSNYVQLDISQLIAANAQNVRIAIGSVQAGEGYNIYGSHLQGTLGTLLVTNGQLDNTFFNLTGYP